MKVKLGLSNITPSNLIVKAVFIIGKMTGNPLFATPAPALTVIQNKTDELTGAIADSESGDHAIVALKKKFYKELKALLTQLGAYVQSITNGDETNILSSGFQVVTPGGPVGPLEPVSGLSAKTSDFIGQIDLSWEKVDGKDLYVIEMNAGDPNNQELWKLKGFSTKTKFSAKNLQTGATYWFRVAAVGAAGIGPYSDPAKTIAL